MIVRHYIVKGRVQGVGFRWFVLQEASALGLRGWVRNNNAGQVEVTVAGEDAQMQQLEQRLRRGSRGSRVDAVEWEPVPEAEAAILKPFEIEGAW
jgi:acylphosphatase